MQIFHHWYLENSIHSNCSFIRRKEFSSAPYLAYLERKTCFLWKCVAIKHLHPLTSTKLNQLKYLWNGFHRHKSHILFSIVILFEKKLWFDYYFLRLAAHRTFYFMDSVHFINFDFKETSIRFNDICFCIYFERKNTQWRVHRTCK